MFCCFRIFDLNVLQIAIAIPSRSSHHHSLWECARMATLRRSIEGVSQNTSASKYPTTSSRPGFRDIPIVKSVVFIFSKFFPRSFSCSPFCFLLILAISNAQGEETQMFPTNHGNGFVGIFLWLQGNQGYNLTIGPLPSATQVYRVFLHKSPRKGPIL